MKKKWEATEEKGSIVKCGEYIWMNIWCMLGSRNTLHLHTVDQLMRSAKNDMLFYLSVQRIRHRLNGPTSECKRWVCFQELLPEILESSSQSMKFKSEFG